MSIQELEDEITRITNRHIARALKPLDNFDIPHTIKKEVSSEFWNLKDDIVAMIKLSKSIKGDDKSGMD